MLLKDILNKLFWGVEYQLYFLDNDFQIIGESNICRVNNLNKLDNFVSQFLNYKINGIDLMHNTIIITILLEKEDFIKCM